MTTQQIQLREAIIAGQRALQILQEAEKEMRSAANWGMFDLLGGDFIATLVKRSKLKEGRSLISEAKQALAAFQRELRDVEILTDLDFDDDGLLAFADYVFDDFFSDFLVQRKIDKTRDQLAKIKKQVSSIVAALKAKYQTL